MNSQDKRTIVGVVEVEQSLVVHVLGLVTWNGGKSRLCAGRRGFEAGK